MASTATMQSLWGMMETLSLTDRNKKWLIEKLSVSMPKEKKTSVAEVVSPSGDGWWNDPKNVEMVNEGRQQLKDGQGVVLSSEEIKARLGL